MYRFCQEILVVPASGLASQTPYPIAGIPLQADKICVAQGENSPSDLLRRRGVLLRDAARPGLQPLSLHPSSGLRHPLQLYMPESAVARTSNLMSGRAVGRALER